METKLILIFLSIFLIGSVFALEQPKDNYVNDFAGIFTGSEINGMREILALVELNTTAQVVVVSVESCNGVPSGYAQSIFDSWKIGDAEKDNGLLVLYCKQENKIWVATGYGLEGILPDSKIGRLLDENYVPYRDSGEIGKGIILSVYAFSEVIAENADEVRAGRVKSKYPDMKEVLFFIIFFLVIMIIIIKVSQNSKSSLWLLPLFIPSGRSSGGGFGGGFSGFGGGMSGGGGAGR